MGSATVERTLQETQNSSSLVRVPLSAGLFLFISRRWCVLTQAPRRGATLLIFFINLVRSLKCSILNTCRISTKNVKYTVDQLCRDQIDLWDRSEDHFCRRGRRPRATRSRCWDGSGTSSGVRWTWRIRKDLVSNAGFICHNQLYNVSTVSSARLVLM